ncbi:hypothetical protein SLS62_004063 [Diatrype stigma]|uniref:Uncharacterized protein n=1 Tax=Diatrype stigma TaxID=117547 RepID=A0AAN9YTR5_9PEZI
MVGPRLTAPVSKIARSLSTSASAAVPKSTSGTILTSSKAAAPLSRKYADLLKERNIEWDHSRHIYTRSSNRPHPAPKTMRLMQTFTTSTPREAQDGATAATTMDRMIIPFSTQSSAEDAFTVRVPLLPDNFATQYAPEEVAGPLAGPQIHIVAANPETVVPAAFTEVEGMGVDGVELKFVHEAQASETQEPGMITGMWKGLVDDVFGNSKSGGRLAV